MYYYAPEATINDRFIFDGIYAYEAIGSLTGLDGRKRKRRKRFFRKIGKGLKKIGKVAFKVVKKVIPIAAKVASYIPVYGSTISAALTAVDMGINAAERFVKKRKKRRKNRHAKTAQRPISNQPLLKKVKENQYRDNNVSVRSAYALDSQTYKKKIKPSGIPNKNKVSPAMVIALNKATQPNPKDYIQLIEDRSKNNLSKKAVRVETKAQMRSQKHNIFNEVIEDLFN